MGRPHMRLFRAEVFGDIRAVGELHGRFLESIHKWRGGDECTDRREYVIQVEV